jgi:hypothetical protein
MGHSSIVPIALPISIVIGVAFYSFFHGSCGMDPASSIVLAKIACGVANLGIGIPKNALLGDILSLVAVRPISLVAAVTAVAWIAQP